jgi:hypothetical protein
MICRLAELIFSLQAQKRLQANKDFTGLLKSRVNKISWQNLATFGKKAAAGLRVQKSCVQNFVHAIFVHGFSVHSFSVHAIFTYKNY